MKKTLFILICLNFSIFVLAQEKVEEKNIVIYSTSNKNTNLFFSNPIKNGIVGNPNFTFGYSKENHGKIGILKSTPGEESNLLVITENGNIYSFLIRYKKDIEKFNYFINDSLSIGNESGEILRSEKPEKKINKMGENEEKSEFVENNISEAVTVNNYEINEKVTDTSDVYKNLCIGEIKKSAFYSKIYGKKDKITVKLKSVSYLNNDLYFTVILKNESKLDYDINFLNFYISSKNKIKNSTTQTIPYKPKYVYNLPTKIKLNDNIEVVYVFEKFSINENKVLLVEMEEINGERTVTLEIPNNFINNPN